MAINERIKFLRNLRGQTQKWLGMQIGFPEKAADVRMAQYETGNRTPKEKMVEDIANALNVSHFALDVPNFDNHHSLLHTLFAMEDLFGFMVNEIENRICLTLDINHPHSSAMEKDLRMWYEIAKKYRNGEMTKEEYDDWRYNYPASQWKNTKDNLDKTQIELELSYWRNGDRIKCKINEATHKAKDGEMVRSITFYKNRKKLGTKVIYVDENDLANISSATLEEWYVEHFENPSLFEK